MRRDNLNDFHKAATNKANSKDHNGGKNKKAVTAHPASEKFGNDDYKKRPQNPFSNSRSSTENEECLACTHALVRTKMAPFLPWQRDVHGRILTRKEKKKR